LSQAVKLLEDAAAQKNADAIFTLAEMNFWGNYSHPRNYSEAFRRYHELATLDGNASAQHMVGFMYATGIGGAVEKDQARAMLYHTLAAEGGDVRSEMTIAYRHSSGIATPRNCDEAVHFYREVAKKAIAYMRSGPPGGHSMPRESFRIADEEGGVYGEGASASSSGPNAKTGNVHSDAYSSLDDVVEYMDLQARKGDARASFNLAKLNYDGARTSKRDLPAAKKRFLELARMYWDKNGKTKQGVSPLTEKLAAKAAGYLGRMFLRGEGMPQSFDIARTWFRRGIEHGDALSQYSLGLMYLKGLGVPENPVKAAELFGAAADDDLAVAQVRLGALFLDQGDVPTAMKYFDLAARHGHIEAYYYLAELAHHGVGRDKSCHVASAYYKIVAEKAELISTSFPEANEAYANGDLETALVRYMMAAEQGFEVGQANVAYLLDQVKPKFTLGSLLPFAKKKASLASDAVLALIYWTRSAEQKNVDSMVKMGDYYLQGFGTTPDHEKAAACYQAAAETLRSAQSMWNLGWMHENGIGVDQDFHLAKRHYDLALETNPREAHLPVLLALYKLRFRSWWNTITNGNIKSIQDEPGKSLTLMFLPAWLTPGQPSRRTSPSRNGSAPSSKLNSPAGTTTSRTTTKTISTAATATMATTLTQTSSRALLFWLLVVRWLSCCIIARRDRGGRRRRGRGSSCSIYKHRVWLQLLLHNRLSSKMLGSIRTICFGLVVGPGCEVGKTRGSCMVWRCNGTCERFLSLRRSTCSVCISKHECTNIVTRMAMNRNLPDFELTQLQNLDRCDSACLLAVWQSTICG
jgi:SEL1 protein